MPTQIKETEECLDAALPHMWEFRGTDSGVSEWRCVHCGNYILEQEDCVL